MKNRLEYKKSTVMDYFDFLHFRGFEIKHRINNISPTISEVFRIFLGADDDNFSLQTCGVIPIILQINISLYIICFFFKFTK